MNPVVSLVAKLLFLTVIKRKLLLPLESLRSMRNVMPVVVLHDHVTALGLAHDLLDMNYHIGRVFNKRLVMRDEKNYVLPPIYQPL